MVISAWLLLSLLLLPMIKYPRGGYLLISFYLLVLAGGVRLAMVMAAARSRGRCSGPAAVVLLSILLLAQAFVRVNANTTHYAVVMTDFFVSMGQSVPAFRKAGAYIAWILL